MLQRQSSRRDNPWRCSCNLIFINSTAIFIRSLPSLCRGSLSLTPCGFDRSWQPTNARLQKMGEFSYGLPWSASTSLRLLWLALSRREFNVWSSVHSCSAHIKPHHLAQPISPTPFTPPPPTQVDVLREGDGGHEWADGSTYEGSWKVQLNSPLAHATASHSAVNFKS
jgi:hypothetical protein